MRSPTTSAQQKCLHTEQLQLAMVHRGGFYVALDLVAGEAPFASLSMFETLSAASNAVEVDDSVPR